MSIVLIVIIVIAIYCIIKNKADEQSNNLKGIYDELLQNKK